MELQWARIVVDHFHLVRGANTALDSIRRERQRERATVDRRAPAAQDIATAGTPSFTEPGTCCSRPPSA
jgi:transposase